MHCRYNSERKRCMPDMTKISRILSITIVFIILSAVLWFTEIFINPSNLELILVAAAVTCSFATICLISCCAAQAINKRVSLYYRSGGGYLCGIRYEYGYRLVCRSVGTAYISGCDSDSCAFIDYRFYCMVFKKEKRGKQTEQNIIILYFIYVFVIGLLYICGCISITEVCRCLEK